MSTSTLLPGAGPVPRRPLVKTHPQTGRKSLLIGRHAHAVPGMDAAESERVVRRACQLFDRVIVAVAAVVPGAQVGAGLLIVALVIDLVKKSDAEGTWQASHFSWRIRTVIWAGVLYIVTAPFWLLGLFLFNPVWVVISLWFLYRIVRGMLAMSKNQAVDA